jgi:hypothetical protein
VTALAPSIGARPRGVGSTALAVATLSDLGMPWAEIGAILETNDPRLVRRYLLLHAERLEERLADQRKLLLSVEPILADRGLSPRASGGLAPSGGVHA